MPRGEVTPRKLNRSTARSASAGSRAAALRMMWESMKPPAGRQRMQRHQRRDRRLRSSGSASSPTSVSPSAVCSSMSSRRAGSSHPASRSSTGPLLDLPAVRVPVPPGGEVVGLTHEPVGAPGHDVRGDRGNLDSAAGAGVVLHRGGGGQRLHGPQAVPFGFGVRMTEQGAGQVDLVVGAATAADRRGRLDLGMPPAYSAARFKELLSSPARFPGIRGCRRQKVRETGRRRSGHTTWRKVTRFSCAGGYEMELRATRSLDTGQVLSTSPWPATMPRRRTACRSGR